MSLRTDFQKISARLDDHVATIELNDPPHNFFSLDLIGEIGDALEALDLEPECRAIVLAAQGSSFCAGANFGAGGVQESKRYPGHLYDQALRVFRTKKPIVAAVHGPAIGGGLGLALAADFRVTCPEARFSANFSRLGFHPGFGLTETLPALVGRQNGMLLLLTGRRVKGDEAAAMGMADRLVPQPEVRKAAYELAGEIAGSAPLSLLSIRAALRAGLADRVKAATDREKAEQDRLFRTEDSREGIRAYGERRTPEFKGR